MPGKNITVSFSITNLFNFSYFSPKFQLFRQNKVKLEKETEHQLNSQF